MEKQHDKNADILYVDQHGVVHQALVTRWWDGMPTARGCNLVYVTDDVAKTDPYGSQIERATSVVHKSNQGAPGRYWMWADEVTL